MGPSFVRSLALFIGLSCLTCSAWPLLANDHPICDGAAYEAGAAHGDITGPIADRGMMGYADPKQVSTGLHMRLLSRALVLRASCPEGKPVALVTNDMAMIFYGLKRAILTSLEVELPGVFSDGQLLLSATHTHAGLGGFAHHLLYNVTTRGFYPDVFDAIRRGTVRAIVQAYKKLAPAQLTLAQGEVPRIQYNRSPEAYARNPKAERDAYGRDYDPTMVLLKVSRLDGTPMATMNWFAIHPVSLPMENRLVSGDNKGLAAYLVEKNYGTTYGKRDEFVAAFVQESAGDISPYPLTVAERANTDGFARNHRAALAQATKALELLKEADTPVSGPLEVAHHFVDLAHRQVASSFADKTDAIETCGGSLGVGFAAGTENGQPLKIFREGTIYGRNWPRMTVLPWEQRCQKEKVVLLPTGLMKPWPWTATVAPFQIVRVGTLAIVATPFEITTMAGRRLRQQVLDTLAPAGVTHVVISALANEYLHYVTTREEYAAQDYEGGSNLFGPWSLAAATEIYSQLSREIMGAPRTTPDPQPLDLSAWQIVLTKTPKYDIAPPRAHFGDVTVSPKGDYQPGDTAEASFWCAHPNRQTQAFASFMTVEKQTADGWTVIRHDWDEDTFFIWQKPKTKVSAQCLAKWTIPKTMEPGTYRLCHHGTYSLPAAGPSPYSGCAEDFTIQAP